MKNVTVTLPEDTALWLRVRAADANRSVSSWLAETVEEMRRREDDYEVAMARALARKPRKMTWVDGRQAASGREGSGNDGRVRTVE